MNPRPAVGQVWRAPWGTTFDVVEVKNFGAVMSHGGLARYFFADELLLPEKHGWLCIADAEEDVALDRIAAAECAQEQADHERECRDDAARDAHYKPPLRWG